MHKSIACSHYAAHIRINKLISLRAFKYQSILLPLKCLVNAFTIKLSVVYYANLSLETKELMDKNNYLPQNFCG